MVQNRNKSEFTFTLPEQLLEDLVKGCKRYKPIGNVSFTPQKNHAYNPHVAAWSINAIIAAYRQYCDKTQGDLLPLDVEPDVTTLYWHESLNVLDEKIRCGYIGKIKPIKDDPANRIVIALRGTEKLDEWIENLEYAQTEVSFNNVPDTVTIHKGFWDLLSKPATRHIPSFFEKIKNFFIKLFTGKTPATPKDTPSLLDQINTLLPKYLSKTERNEIYIAGHSLGAAVASLVTIECILNVPNAKIITYVIGCPRVGGPSLSELIRNLSEDRSRNFCLWRLTNTEDVVTTVPLPVVRGLIYSQLFISKTDSPNTVGTVAFSDNLGTIPFNHDPMVYHYANEQLMPGAPEDITS